MIGFFKNLSGRSWFIFRMEWWYIAFYTPWFGVSINIHPNRFKQFYREVRG